jgi:crotonobetainyl-CoA:carnitine CoA-transferase CaiB-like acyl-CoA transferase
VDELEETGQAMHFPWGKVNTIPQVIEDIQLNARGYFVTVKDPSGRACKFPGVPVKMSASPWQVNPVLPAAGEYNQEVFCRRLSLSSEELSNLALEGVI